MTRSTRLALPILLALALLAACTEDDKAKASPGRFLARYQVASKSEQIRDTLAGRFAEARVDVRIRSAREAPAEDVPEWMKGKDGWIVYVDPGQVERAEAVWRAWLDVTEVTTRESGRGQPAQSQPAQSRPAQSRPALVLGPDTPVDAGTVASIQAELQRRAGLDQEARRDPGRRDRMKEIDTANTAWLKETVSRIGWIDVDRFGTKAANSAFLLVQHSGDLALMNAALPRIESDVAKGRLDAENFAMLFDRTQLMQGHKQRYGTQVMREGKDGGWVVERLEDPDRVDQRRKEIGLGPLQDYLSRFGDAVRIGR